MKDQYFGDYQKVSLLKYLQDNHLKVLVHWMRTKDDESTDGKHITYLEKPKIWRQFHEDVFDFLKLKIASGERHLKHIEDSSYGSGITFLNEYIEDIVSRDKALKQLIKSDSDVVFFDPDNGIEVASTNKKNIHKYVMWDEIIQAFESEKSVIIYQHFSRTNRETFIQDKAKEIQKHVSCPTISVQVRHSVYFFLIQPKHEKKLQNTIKEFSSSWKHLAIVRNH